MSPIRAGLIHSPGLNEGKARNATLGKHRQKQIELRWSGTYNTSIGALAFWEDCAAPLGLNKCVSMINPGLAAWAMQEYRPKGLLYVFPIDTLYCFDALSLSNTMLMCKTFFIFASTNLFLINPEREQVQSR